MNVLSFKNVNKNIISLFFVQFSNYLVPIIILPYLSRVVGIDGVGIISIALSLCAISFIVTDFGFTVSSTYWVSQNRDMKEKVSRYIGSVFVLKTILVFIVLLGLYVYSYFSKQAIFNSHWMLLAISMSVLFQAFQITWFFQGIEKMKNITFCVAFSKFSYLILVILVVKKPGDEVLALFSFGLSNMLSMLLGIYLYKKEGYKIIKPSFYEVTKLFKNTFSFFMSRASVGIYTSASTLIIGNFAGVQQAALYSSAEKLYQASLSMTSPISQALYPYLARTSDKKLLYKFLLIFLPIMIVGVSGCIYFSKEIITLIYGASFISAAGTLKIFLIISVISFISINFGYPAYSTINRLDIVNRSVMIGAICQLALLSYLYYIDKITANNVALSILCIEIIIMLYRVGYYFYLIKGSKNG